MDKYVQHGSNGSVLFMTNPKSTACCWATTGISICPATVSSAMFNGRGHIVEKQTSQSPQAFFAMSSSQWSVRFTTKWFLSSFDDVDPNHARLTLHCRWSKPNYGGDNNQQRHNRPSIVIDTSARTTKLPPLAAPSLLLHHPGMDCVCCLATQFRSPLHVSKRWRL